MTIAAGERLCPACGKPNPLDLAKKCASCRRALPAYCFACYAALPHADIAECPACGRRRWVFGDHTELPCASERNQPRREHRWMTTIAKGGRVMHEWRCMKCLTDETYTDAFVHFPGPAA